jgi:hypothetical protein
MTQFEFILILVAALTTTWAGLITAVAKIAIRKYKERVEYYQSPNTQIEIASHVIQNKWYTTGQEVFR